MISTALLIISFVILIAYIVKYIRNDPITSSVLGTLALDTTIARTLVDDSDIVGYDCENYPARILIAGCGYGNTLDVLFDYLPRGIGKDFYIDCCENNPKCEKSILSKISRFPGNFHFNVFMNDILGVRNKKYDLIINEIPLLLCGSDLRVKIFDKYKELSITDTILTYIDRTVFGIRSRGFKTINTLYPRSLRKTLRCIRVATL